MKRLTCFSLAILAASLLFSLPAGPPAHDARFLKLAIVYELHEDGSWDMTCEQQARLDTYYAFNRALGETFIVYNPEFQNLEVLKAETTMAAGRKLAAPDNAFNEVLPFAAHGFADFSHLREMVVTHPGLERGALVDLKYRIHTQAGFLPVFSGREALVRDFPVDAFSLLIKVPHKQALHHRIFGLQAELKKRHDPEQAQDIYSLSFLNAPAAAHEPQAAPQSGPCIVFSVASDWPRALTLANDPTPLPAVLLERIGKLKTQYPARADVMAELQKIVAVEVKGCRLDSDACGWQPRPLARVFLGNYGSALEKALLLRAMLGQAGIEAELLAVATGAAFAADVPAAQQLGEFWLKVNDGPHALYLDPFREQHEFFPYRLQERDAWNLEKRALEKLPASERQGSGVEVSGTVQLAADGVSGDLVVAARGFFNRYNEAAADNGKFITGLLRQIFPVEKVEVKKLLALSRREFRVEAAFSGKWLKESGTNFLSAAGVRLPGISDSLVISTRRESPLQLEAPFQVSVRLDLRPAAGLSLEYRAPDVQVKNEAGHFMRTLRLEKDGHIRFAQSGAIEINPVTPALYPRLRELFMPYFTPDYWLVFKKSNY